MAIQNRRGLEADFDASKMLPGEWAVSTDKKYVRMCFAPGICLRMATYEAFEADMEQVKQILTETQDINAAVERIQSEVNDTAIEVENNALLAESYTHGGTGKREGEDTDNARYYMNEAKKAAGGTVMQTNTTTDADFRVLLSEGANDTSSATTARKSAGLTFNPSTKSLKVDGEEVVKKSDIGVVTTVLGTDIAGDWEAGVESSISCITIGNDRANIIINYYILGYGFYESLHFIDMSKLATKLGLPQITFRPEQTIVIPHSLTYQTSTDSFDMPDMYGYTGVMLNDSGFLVQTQGNYDDFIETLSKSSGFYECGTYGSIIINGAYIGEVGE